MTGRSFFSRLAPLLWFAGSLMVLMTPLEGATKKRKPTTPTPEPTAPVAPVEPPKTEPVPDQEIPPAKGPNILFIIVDDLNDWCGWLGGHPQAKTPHMDQLAHSGMRFTNAHC